MEKTAKFVWTKESDESFQRLKQAVTTAPILGYPSTSAEDLFLLDTDACQYGIGSVLSQRQNGVERVNAYYSRSLNKSKRQYCITRKELLAIVASVNTSTTTCMVYTLWSEPTMVL